MCNPTLVHGRIAGTAPATTARMAQFSADSLMAEFGDEELVAELAALMLEHADAQLASIHTAIADGNAQALKSAAHKIKGGMSTFGVPTVTDRALALENMGRAGTLDGAGPLADELTAEVHAFCESARSWLAARAA